MIGRVEHRIENLRLHFGEFSVQNLSAHAATKWLVIMKPTPRGQGEVFPSVAILQLLEEESNRLVRWSEEFRQCHRPVEFLVEN